MAELASTTSSTGSSVALSGFQSNAQGNDFEIEMLTGAWGILMTLEGVDNIYNDPEVEVGIYANADPIQLSASREPLAFASYSMQQEPKFRAVARGRIINGVLTMSPVDVRLIYTVNSMSDDRVLRDAQVRMTSPQMAASKVFWAAIRPLRPCTTSSSAPATGGPPPANWRRTGCASELPKAVRERWATLARVPITRCTQAADGHPDPETGRCTSISTQYRIRLAPAFVLDTETSSANSTLVSR